MTWQVLREVLSHADGAKARAASAVGNAEGLVQIQVANISADHAGRGQAQLGIHVGSIHVDLAAIVMHCLADLLDALLEEGTRGGVGHHQASQAILVLLAQGLELSQVHAIGIIDPLNLHPAHRCGGRVGAVSGARDDAHISVTFSLFLQELADDQQTRILARGPARGLQGASVETCDLVHVVLQRVQHLDVASCLAHWGERVNASHLWPTERHQRGGRIQLHGTGTQGDHRLVQGQVLQLERVHIAHHLCLGMDAVEDLLLQEGSGARQL
mmetsp:Transcript_80144/g.166761  ORF Transcript_80144/g.166761 Transcript_80144/m.166761 type:complete len:271 (-) Transcript_80144:1669-2481(-)